MSDYLVDLIYHPETGSLEFGGAASADGDIPVPVGSSEERWITFNLTGADAILGIKIAGSPAALAEAPAECRGDYPGTCFKALELSPTGTALKMEDAGTRQQDWYYRLGIRFEGEELWPDPKIENNTSGGGFKSLPGLYFR